MHKHTNSHIQKRKKNAHTGIENTFIQEDMNTIQEYNARIQDYTRYNTTSIQEYKTNSKTKNKQIKNGK